MNLVKGYGSRASGDEVFILWDVTSCSLVKLCRHILEYCNIHASVTFETRYILNCPGGKKCPVIFFQFFR